MNTFLLDYCLFFNSFIHSHTQFNLRFYSHVLQKISSQTQKKLINNSFSKFKSLRKS